jgi:hypothetical protein
MKWIFAILLSSSLAFFAFMLWSINGAGDSRNLQPQSPLNADKIKLLPSAAVSSVTALAASSPTSFVAANLNTTSLPAVTKPPVCLEWGNFSGKNLSRANNVLSGLKLGAQLTQHQIEHTIGYWVYIPPLKNSTEVEKKVAQIESLGLEEYFVVEDEGKWHNAISLGVFNSVDTAHKFRESVKAKGLTSAKAGERSSKRTYTVFALKDPDTAILAKITQIQKDFPDSELKAAACN